MASTRRVTEHAGATAIGVGHPPDPGRPAPGRRRTAAAIGVEHGVVGGQQIREPTAAVEHDVGGERAGLVRRARARVASSKPGNRSARLSTVRMSCAADPLQRELADLVARARIRDQLPRPALDARGLVELAGGGGREQGVARRGAEERVRQRGRDLVRPVSRNRRRLARRARSDTGSAATSASPGSRSPGRCSRARDSARPRRRSAGGGTARAELVDQLLAAARGVARPVARVQGGGVRRGVVGEGLGCGEVCIDVRRGDDRRRPRRCRTGSPPAGLDRRPASTSDRHRRRTTASIAEFCAAEPIGHGRRRSRVLDPLVLVEHELVLVHALADRERARPQAGRARVGERRGRRRRSSRPSC